MNSSRTTAGGRQQAPVLLQPASRLAALTAAVLLLLAKTEKILQHVINSTTDWIKAHPGILLDTGAAAVLQEACTGLLPESAKQHSLQQWRHNSLQRAAQPAAQQSPQLL